MTEEELGKRLGEMAYLYAQTFSWDFTAKLFLKEINTS